MKKRFLLKTMLLLCALIAGSTSSWAEDVVYKTLSFSAETMQTGVQSYTATWENISDGFTWTLTNFNNNNKGWNLVKCGRKNNASVATIVTKTAIDKAITKVVVTIDAITANKVNSIKLYTSTDGTTWSSAGSFTISTDAQTVTLSSPTADLYYKIEFDCDSGSSNGLVTVSKVEYYIDNSTPGEPSISSDDVNIAYSATSGSIAYTINNEPTPAGTLSAEITAGNDGDWLTLGQGTTSPISFTCSANEAHSARTATVTLTYTYNTNETVTKDVTVTQAGVPYTTIQALYDDATSSATDVTITFGGWVVSGVKNSNAYITDNQGHGLIIYTSDHGFQVNDVLTGTASCKLQKYNGSAELTNLTSTTDGLTVANNGTVTVVNIAMADLAGVNTGALVSYQNLTCSSSNNKYYLSDGTTTLQVYNNLYDFGTLDTNKKYNITGVYLQYDTSNSSTKEIMPRSADDIKEYQDPYLSVNPTTAEAFTYVYGNGPSEDQMFEVTGAYLTSNDIVATITTGDSYFELTDDETYSNTVTIASGDAIAVRMKAGLAIGPYQGTLTLSTTGAQGVVITLSGTVTDAPHALEKYRNSIPGGSISFSPESPIVEGTTVTLTATPEDGYNFDSWTFYKEDGNDIVVDNSIVVTNNTFSMPNYDLYVDATFVEAIDITYDFSSADNFYTIRGGEDHPATGNTNSIDKFYYSNGDKFTASGASHYFGDTNNKYFIFGKSGAKINLPKFANYKVTRIVLHSSSSGSTNVSIAIVNGDNEVASAQTWTIKNNDYVYDIPAAYQTAPLSVKVTNAYNAQLTSITLVREALAENVTVTATIASSGYTTLSSDYALDFSGAMDDNLEGAYVVSALSATKASFTKVESAVPAETGLVLHGTPGAIVNIPTVATASALGTTNFLHECVDGGTVDASSVYAMSGGVFKLYTGTELPVGKAYLLASEVPGNAPELSFEIGGETTSIRSIDNGQWTIDNVIYDLNGRRIENPTKGVYIMNGKKVVIK